MSAPPGRAQRREVLALAVPAFLALVAEPLFLLADSAIIGHVGTIPLAGLGVAGAVLLTAAGLFVFLAYATTASVARQLGAGSTRGALAAGLDGLWLSLAIGVVVAAIVAGAAYPLAGAFGASDAVRDQAATYLRIAAFGLPAMLASLAVTGVLRGLLDTRTPLVVSVIGFGANVVLNLVLVTVLDFGIAGSAFGTLVAQTAMAGGLVVVLVRRAREASTPLRPHPGRVLAAALHGAALFGRTVALRLVLLLTVGAAASFGDPALAAHQISATLWSFLAFALDALAIAAQAIVGRDLGAGRADAARAATSRLLRWGVGFGLVVGVALVAIRPMLLTLFTTDPVVVRYAAGALIVVAAGQVVSGYVFVGDGVLMGAGDHRYLAAAMAVSLAAYLPMVWMARLIGQRSGPQAGLVGLWLAYVGFMLVRAATLGWRMRGDRWLVTGIGRGR
ncbi:MAG: MATE family efflux transporter [Dermatophilaceae bacterium]